MKISSDHINNLLAYARERHGAPCRVWIDEFDGEIWASIDVKVWSTAEEIEIPTE